MGTKRKIITVGLGLNLAWTGACKQDSPELAPDKLDFSNAPLTDSIHTSLWKNYLQGRKLLEAWSPVTGSPWNPYLKPTLFSSLDDIGDRAQPIYGPAERTAEEQSRIFARNEKISDKEMVIVDLPGDESVAWGVALARAQGLQPIVTFNNWPHQRGVLKAERVLGALIYYAAEMDQLKKDGKITRKAQPAFILDANRLGINKNVKGRDFDNRYYLSESDLPSADPLKAAGIRHVLYIVASEDVKQEQDDLNAYFAHLEAGGIDFALIPAQKYADENQVLAEKKERRATVHSSHSSFPWWFFYLAGRSYRPSLRPTIFNTGRGADQFIRSAGGGFGGYHGTASGGGG